MKAIAGIFVVMAVLSFGFGYIFANLTAIFLFFAFIVLASICSSILDD